jgi:HoxN/HupN/NixA family high-affinity nickel-transporter
MVDDRPRDPRLSGVASRPNLRARLHERIVEQDFDILLDNRGSLARLFRPLFQLVTRSWHLFPVGFLFGLRFHTATKVVLFGLSAAQASSGMSLGTILVFPALFTAGTFIGRYNGRRSMLGPMARRF